MRSAQQAGAAIFLLLQQLAVVAVTQRPEIDAYGRSLSCFMLFDRPGMKLCQHGRFIGFRQPLFCRLQMGIARAAPPDVALGVGRFSFDLGKGFAGTFPRHRHGNAGGFLKFVDHGLAPFFLRCAIHGEIAFGLCR